MQAVGTSTGEGAGFHGLPGGSVDSLVVFLRERGFAIGPSEAIDAARLLLHLARQAPQAEAPDKREWLAQKLRPVFCKNREDQERFDALFAEWAGSSSYLPEQAAPATSKVPPPPPPPPWKPWKTAAVVCGVLLLGLPFWLREQSPPEPTPRPTEKSPSAESAPRPSTATLPAGEAPVAREEPFAGLFPAVRYNLELKPWVGGGLLGLAALAVLGLAIPFAVPWLSHSRRGGRPITLDDSSLRKEAERIVPPLSVDVGARLGRHVSGPAVLRQRLQRRPPLDLERTIEATLRRLGMLQLRYRAARLIPSYLLLVDVANEQDPRGRMFYHWAQRLQRQGIEVDIRLFRYDAASATARTVRPADSEWRLNGRDGEPLDRLPAPPVGQRLIVVSDGDALVELVGQAGRWRDWAQRAGFHRWSERAVFTPVEPRSWGGREEAIERAERSADRGFIILPLDEAALAAWAELVVTGRLPEFSLSRPQRYPRLLRTYEEQGLGDRLLADTPAFEHDTDLADLIAELKLYLGENGYYWLCACAVPPIIRWQFTLLLGEQYLLNAGVEEGDLPGFIARYYARLANLPWMRQQKMPDWLRLALLDSVPPAIQQELRQVLLSRLGQLQPAAGGLQTLQLEEPPGPLGRRRQPMPAAEKMIADSLYLGYLEGRTPRQLILRAPGEWSAWLAKLPSRRRAGLVGDWLAALRDRMLWRNGLSFLGASRRAWLVFTLATALLLGLVAWLAVGDPAGLPPGLRAALYDEIGRAVAVVHHGSVRFAAFSPDGQRMLTASEDGSARLWDAETGKPLGKPLRHQGVVIDAAFSPDGRRVVTAGGWRARVWDAASGEPLGITLGHEAEVNSAVFSPDGGRVLTASSDGTARLWDAASGSALGQVMGQNSAVNSAVFSPDGERVLTADVGEAQLWDGHTGQLQGEAMHHADRVNSAAFSPDGRRVVTASDDGTARLWDAATGRPLGPAMRHDGKVFDAVFSPDGSRVLTTASFDAVFSPDGSRVLTTASDTGTARLWDADTGQRLGEPIHPGAVFKATFSPDGRRVVTAGDDGTARLWDAANDSPLGEPLRHSSGRVFDAAFSPDGKRLVTAGDDGIARVWEERSGRPAVTSIREDGQVFDASFSPDGRHLLTASSARSAQLWDAAGGAPVGQPMPHQGAVNRAAFSPDGKHLVTASEDYSARLWEAPTGSPLGTPMRHGAAVNDAAFSPDGTRVVTASSDASARLWNAASGAPLGEPMRHQAAVGSAVFSSDGGRVLTASVDQTAQLWDARSGSPMGQTMVHGGAVLNAAFSADGRRVVTASADRTARVWDAASGEPLGKELRHEAAVYDAAFSPDGGRVVTASKDGSARLWEVPAGRSLGEPMRHQAAVRRAAFSPDGSRVVTASDDKTARLWDAHSGAALGEALRNEGVVFDASFSPSGDRVLTAWGVSAPGPAPASPEAAQRNLPATPQQVRELPAAATKEGKSAVVSRKPPPAAQSQEAPPPDSGGEPSTLESRRQAPRQQQEAVQQPEVGPLQKQQLPPSRELPQPAPRAVPRSQTPLEDRLLATVLGALNGWLPSAWAQERMPVAARQDVQQALAGSRGGALLWRAAPNPLPVPREPDQLSLMLMAGVAGSVLAGFLVLAIALGWRAHRQLAALGGAEAARISVPAANTKAHDEREPAVGDIGDAGGSN